MERRDFLTTSLAAAAVALTGSSEAEAGAQTPAGSGREYYEIRKYHLQSGPQTKLTETYVSDALIPALNRLGIAPVGAFHLDIGPETPTLYLLLPCASVETLVTAELRLAGDAEFMKAAEPFWNAPATAPAYQRIESTLHVAFAGHPKLTLPASTATHGKRIFQLRIYESPSSQAHLRKVEMFSSWRVRHLQERGMRGGVLQRYADRAANAESDVHAQLSGSDGVDGEVEGLCDGPGVGEAEELATICV